MICTCAGTAPGYPQHESHCGQTEDNYDQETEELFWQGFYDKYSNELPPDDDPEPVELYFSSFFEDD